MFKIFPSIVEPLVVKITPLGIFVLEYIPVILLLPFTIIRVSEFNCEALVKIISSSVALFPLIVKAVC